METLQSHKKQHWSVFWLSSVTARGLECLDAMNRKALRSKPPLTPDWGSTEKGSFME